MRITFVLLALCCFGLYANAQDRSQQLLFNQTYATAEKAYGIPQALINGVLFEMKNQDAIGHPYFLDYHKLHGSVTYRGKEYVDLFLKYDIYDQQVLLYYQFDTVEYQLYLQKEFISAFTIENKNFVHEVFGNDQDAKFYQVIGEDTPSKILYHWKKGLTKLYENVPGRNKIFSSEEKETFLFLDNELLGYKGNRSFSRKFEAKNNSVIKRYLRKHKLKVKEADDHEMELLIAFINSLDI